MLEFIPGLLQGSFDKLLKGKQQPIQILPTGNSHYEANLKHFIGFHRYLCVFEWLFHCGSYQCMDM